MLSGLLANTVTDKEISKKRYFFIPTQKHGKWQHVSLLMSSYDIHQKAHNEQ